MWWFYIRPYVFFVMYVRRLFDNRCTDFNEYFLIEGPVPVVVPFYLKFEADHY